jgi:hypothetical protein
MGGDEIEERRERDLSSLGLSGRAAAYNYLHNPTRPISGSVLFASCRCQLIGVNLCFGLAAAKSFVWDVLLPMSRAIHMTK